MFSSDLSTPCGRLLQIRTLRRIRQPREIKVQVLEVDVEGHKLVSLSSLMAFREYAVFVGLNQSACFPTMEFPELRPNCVYFTPPRLVQRDNFGLPGWRGVGIYDLENQTFEYVFSSFGPNYTNTQRRNNRYTIYLRCRCYCKGQHCKIKLHHLSSSHVRDRAPHITCTHRLSFPNTASIIQLKVSDVAQHHAGKTTRGAPNATPIQPSYRQNPHIHTYPSTKSYTTAPPGHTYRSYIAGCIHSSRRAGEHAHPGPVRPGGRQPCVLLHPGLLVIGALHHLQQPAHLLVIAQVRRVDRTLAEVVPKDVLRVHTVHRGFTLLVRDAPSHQLQETNMHGWCIVRLLSILR